MNLYDPNTVIPEAFERLDCSVDNFEKIRSVESDLLWGEQSRIPNPWLSVIIPTYNRTELLEKAIGSVLRQTEVEYSWELIVIDNTPLDSDGKTPALNVVKKIANPRVLYFHNRENIGSGYNWNRGVEKARGIWISFLHDDDLMYDDALESIARIISKKCCLSKPLGYIQARFDEFSRDECLRRQPKKQRPYLLELTRLGTLITYYTRTGMPSCGTTILRQAYLEHGGINYDFGPTADAVLGYQIMRNYTVLLSDRTFGGYRWGVNESLKIDTAKKLILADSLLADYCYGRSLVTRLWGSFFGKVQYEINVEIKERTLKQGSTDTEKQNLVDETDPRGGMQVTRFLYRSIVISYRMICCIKAMVKGIL